MKSSRRPLFHQRFRGLNPALALVRALSALVLLAAFLAGCDDRPFGAGAYAGFAFGAEWLYAGMKYGIGGTSWDGLQLLPGINVGSSFGPKGFKIIPAVDMYFYQWPLDMFPDPRIIYGLGIRASY